MSIITVSREIGSLGDQTAVHLANELHYTLMDRAAMEKIIDGLGLPEAVLERFKEHSPSFWENFTNGKDITWTV